MSCLACIFGGQDQWASVRKIAPDRFARIAAYEQEFGVTIKRGVTVGQLADRGTPFPQCEDAALVKLAMGDEYPADQVQVPEDEEWRLPAGAFLRGGGPN